MNFRPRCLRCRRPQSVCYCAALPTLDTRTRVVILQHPRERDMPIGTARMASLCLPNAELHVGIRWGESAALAAALADPARPPILLYPGADARDVLTEPPAGPVTLVVVDGTWSQAKTVVRDNPILHALPRYAFTAPALSQYRIRREPRAEYVSTIEALMYVLGALEGEPARFRAMLDPLNAMVDAQLAHQANAPRRAGVRQPKGPRPARRRLPAELFERYADLVCIAGEANAWPYHAGGQPDRDELVHWVAHRPATGETFDMICAPQAPLAPSTAFHTGIDEDALRAGVSRAQLLDAFAAWSRPTDVTCMWGYYGSDLFAAAGGTLPATQLDLRAAAHRLTNKKVGRLEDFAATLGEPPPALSVGRAGRRVALLAQVVAAWLPLNLTT